MKHVRRILYASDFSKASARAFQTAMTLAKANQARLAIVHVIVLFVPVVPEQYVDSGTLDRE
jgi:nucleotide-binding universal stress UspA family protein